MAILPGSRPARHLLTVPLQTVDPLDAALDACDGDIDLVCDQVDEKDFLVAPAIESDKSPQHRAAGPVRLLWESEKLSKKLN